MVMSLGARRLSRVGAAVLSLVLAAVLLATGPFGGTARAATYTPTLSTFNTRLLYDINHARASHGVRQLVLAAGTTDVAHRWSCHMAYWNVLGHNPNLGYALEHHGSWNWQAYRENVRV